MTSKRFFIAAVLIAVGAAPFTLAAPGSQDHEDLHDHENHERASGLRQDDHEGHGGHEEHAEEWQSRISAEMAKEVGITVAEAGPGVIQRTVKVYGTLAIPQEQVSHIRARFPGLITSVTGQIGDSVKPGDVLAEVESNESLSKYAIRAPIAGVITERHANLGEATGDQVLFSIASFDPLWAELKIFPHQRQAVRQGQAALVVGDELQQSTTLRHVLPGSGENPFVVARAEVDNADGRWAPGVFIAAEIGVETFEAPLIIDNRALQTLEGRDVVFVQEGDIFEARPVEIGRADSQRSEVLSGIAAGDHYVVANSYLIKADIEKSAAAHHH